MNNTFNERASKYKRVLNSDVVSDLWSGLLLKRASGLENGGNKRFERLFSSVINYISESFSFTDVNFDKLVSGTSGPKYVSILDPLAPYVHQLPNLTPNGALYPKKEIFNSYNQLCSTLVDYVDLKAFGIDLIAPPTIRMKTSMVPNGVAKRKTYTGIAHSDAWVGHHGSGVMSLIVAGDAEKLGVSFFEPINPGKNFLTNLGNFEEGYKTYEDKRFIAGMTLGDIFLFDHAVLHKTEVNCDDGSEHVRVSIDMAYKLDATAAEEGISLEKADTKRFKYLSGQDFNLLGKEKFIMPAESIYDEIDQSKKAFSPTRIFKLHEVDC